MGETGPKESNVGLKVGGRERDGVGVGEENEIVRKYEIVLR